MADYSSLMKSHESQDGEGQAQARRLDETLMMSGRCEPQDNMQQGMGQGDALKDAAGGGNAAAATSSGPVEGESGGESGGDNSNSGSTYLYTNHSLI